jgi:tRNA threonylcarbamoyladenosine biosynthesis protein TsaE
MQKSIKFTRKDLPGTIISTNEEMTEHIASDIYLMLLKDLSPVFLLLEGEMGAGKTAFCRGLGQAAGVTEVINSPTFNLLNEYTGNQTKIYHYDFYRLHDPSDLEDLGFAELWKKAVKDGLQEIHIMEWWSLAADLLPDHSDIFLIKISGNPEHDPDERTIEIFNYNQNR